GHLQTLCGLFYLRAGIRITDMTCAYVKRPETEAEQAALSDSLRQLQLFVTLLHTTPGDDEPFVGSAESASQFVFAPKPRLRVSKLEGGVDKGRVDRVGPQRPNALDADGYVGVRNGFIPLHVDAHSQLHPEPPSLELWDVQDLSEAAERVRSSPENWSLN